VRTVQNVSLYSFYPHSGGLKLKPVLTKIVEQAHTHTHTHRESIIFIFLIF